MYYASAMVVLAVYVIFIIPGDINIWRGLLCAAATVLYGGLLAFSAVKDK